MSRWNPRHSRTCRGAAGLCRWLALLAVLLAPRLGLADEVRLPSQSHREVWHNRAGQALKDFEWTLSPVVSTQSGSLDVRIGSDMKKHADGFAGVAGEIEFCCGPDQKLELTFDDASTKLVTGNLQVHLDAAELANRHLTGIRLSSELVGRSWDVNWTVDAPASSAELAGALPADWVLAANAPVPVSGAGGKPEKGTWLTPTEIKDRPQDVVGIWTDANAEAETEKLQWLDLRQDDLTVHPLSNPGALWVHLGRQAGTDRWSGSGAPPGQRDATGFSICPRPKGTCPQLCKFAAGFLDLAPGALRANGAWHDRRVEPQKCAFLDEPQTKAEQFERFVGVSFAPVAAGKYMYMGMAPAVGNNPAQFKALVRIATNYAGTGAASIGTKVEPPTAMVSRSAGEGLAATYEFSARQHGIYELSFELIRDGGEVFHTDRMRIEIPSVPGIGN